MKPTILFYDRAPSHFHQATLQEKHTLFQKILPSLHCPDVHLTEVNECGEIESAAFEYFMEEY